MRRFFGFAVRDLFWLTLAAGIALAWLKRERQLAAEVNDAKSEVAMAQSAARFANLQLDRERKLVNVILDRAARDAVGSPSSLPLVEVITEHQRTE